MGTNMILAKYNSATGAPPLALLAQPSYSLFGWLKAHAHGPRPAGATDACCAWLRGRCAHRLSGRGWLGDGRVFQRRCG
eukprot:scaffold142173_cov57-Phaeocystis_antarctica.AAC.1